MKNLIGYSLLTLLLFSFLSTHTFANSNVTSSNNLHFTINQKDVDTVSSTIVIKNKSNLPAVVNSYSIFLPFSNITNLKVGTKNQDFQFSSYDKTTGKQLVIRFNNRVIDTKGNYQFSISFNTTFDKDSNWGYLKLPIKFGNLTANQVVISYPDSKPKPAYISEMKTTIKASSGSNVVTVTNPQNSYLSMLFGPTPTYSFELKKNYINYASTSEVYDLILPSSSDKQTLVIQNVSPSPEYTKSDTDSNIILGFKVEAEKQINIHVSGFIVKDESIKFKANRLVEDNIGYWTLSNQKEISRVKSYISTNDYEKNIPKGLSKYIIDNFEIEKLNTTSLENVLRGGINVAIDRKANAIVEDYADCLIAYLRYYGYNARMVIGYIPNSSIYSQTGFFSSWVEYYDETKSDWILLDPAITDVNNMKGEINQNDRIPIIIRETNPITPKLQYFKSDEINITPISSTITPLFKYSLTGNKVANTGNTVLEVKTVEKNIYLLPGSSENISTNNEKITVSNLVNKHIDEKVSVASESNTTNNAILSELILFTTFSITILLLSIIYSRIKKTWRSTHH
jgi:hypothetical protein